MKVSMNATNNKQYILKQGKFESYFILWMKNHFNYLLVDFKH